MRTVLVTGFEPFGGERVNPSQQIAQALDGGVIADRRVIGRVLPCAFREVNRELVRLLQRENPELVICVGQAGGRAAITPERVALNLDDASIPDNAGVQPMDARIVPRGPIAYWSTLPVKAIVAALRARGIPADVSQTAGTFVCNHVFYGLMHALRRRTRVRGGFIHVPFLPEQARGQPSLPLEMMIEAIRLAIAVAFEQRRDARIQGGQTH